MLVDGAAIDHLPANQRNIGIVFQNYALFPHMTVAENVAYGLRARGKRGPERRRRVNRMLDMVQLGAFRDRLPRQLSGGQQQRVALARALAVEPSILLLDEPFAALDRNLRLDMQIEVKRLQRQLGLTTILVTHDQDEAMSVADRIAVMNKGKVEQFDTPVAIYDRPQTLFVNGFIGTTNLLRGKIPALDDGIATVTLDAGATPPAARADGLAAGATCCSPSGPSSSPCRPSPGPEAGGSSPASACRSAPAGARGAHRRRHGAQDRRAAARRAASAAARFCGLAPDARPSLFPRSTPSATEMTHDDPQVHPQKPARRRHRARRRLPPPRPRPRQGQPGRHDLSGHLGGRLPRRRRAAAEEEGRHRSRAGAAVRHGPDRQGQGRARRAPVRRLRARSRPAHRGLEGGIFEKFDGKKLSNLQDPGRLRRRMGRLHVSAQVVGIAYNPKKVPAPKGWTDLLKDPWVSRLGLTGFQTTFGTSSTIELCKQFGGSLTNPDPGLVELKKVLPKIAAVGLPAACPVCSSKANAT